VKFVRTKISLRRKTFPRKAKFSFEGCVKNSREDAKTRSFFGLWLIFPTDETDIRRYPDFIFALSFVKIRVYSWFLFLLNFKTFAAWRLGAKKKRSRNRSRRNANHNL